MIKEIQAEPLPKIFLPAIWFASEILPLEILLVSLVGFLSLENALY